jgi:hypothetical protein
MKITNDSHESLEEMVERHFDEREDYARGIGAYPMNRERPSEAELRQRQEREIAGLKRWLDRRYVLLELLKLFAICEERNISLPDLYREAESIADPERG